MNTAFGDQVLIGFVQRELNSGNPGPIRIPKQMLGDASDVALETVRQLCELNGVSIEVN